MACVSTPNYRSYILFAGTGTTSIVALQTQRNAVSIELAPQNVECIQERLKNIGEADLIQKYYQEYSCTENLAEV